MTTVRVPGQVTAQQPRDQRNDHQSGDQQTASWGPPEPAGPVAAEPATAEPVPSRLFVTLLDEVVGGITPPRKLTIRPAGHPATIERSAGRPVSRRLGRSSRRQVTVIASSFPAR
jgi:hypothetical protein